MGFVWILLYALTGLLFRRIDSSGICPVLLEPWAMLVCSGALLFWLRGSGRQGSVRLNAVRFPPGWGRHLWALLLIPGWNLLFGGELAFSAPVTAAALASAAAEEVFFRGFLLRYLEDRWPKGCIYCSAAAFALVHGVNIPSLGLAEGLLQVLCAFGAGLCYGGAAVYWDSIWVPIAAHFLVNLTGWAGEKMELTGTSVTVLLLCAAASSAAGIRMYRAYIEDRKGA